mmetsp:Transcript_37684/g.43045  ORF Transcript_37684/g.43045 Transcript_37684/m.43045 type:complete len:134 (+) Transcript_37684:55-456(+)
MSLQLSPITEVMDLLNRAQKALLTDSDTEIETDTASSKEWKLNTISSQLSTEVMDLPNNAKKALFTFDKNETLRLYSDPEIETNIANLKEWKLSELERLTFSQKVIHKKATSGSPRKWRRMMRNRRLRSIYFS